MRSEEGKAQFNFDVCSLACYANKLAIFAEQETLNEAISFIAVGLRQKVGDQRSWKELREGRQQTAAFESITDTSRNSSTQLC